MPSSDYFSQLQVQNLKIFAFRRLASLSEGGKKSPFKNSGNSWGEGVIKNLPGMENPAGVQIKESSMDWGGGGGYGNFMESRKNNEN